MICFSSRISAALLQKFKIRLIVLFFLSASVNSLAAQNRAFLESGPISCAGMPGIGINAIDGFRGIYILPVNEATVSLESQPSVAVYFTGTVVPVFSSWRTVAASPYVIYATETEAVYVYIHYDNWSFFMDFRKIENMNLTFAVNIIRQMIFFVRDGSNFINSSFPALVEF